MANVRFYRLKTLPSFEVPKHQGIFVHVTSKLTRTGKEGNYTYSWGELDKDAIPNIVIQNIVEKETTRPILVPEWMDSRRLDTVESGLWFGGENGWELLSNDINSIDATIAALDVPGYAQATITPDTPPAEGVPNSSTLTIKGIQEVDGRIGAADGSDLNIKIDGIYNESNKIATQSTVTTTVTTAINGLNVDTIQPVTTAPAQSNAANTVLTFKGVKEENGKILQGDGATTFTVGDAKLKIQIGSAAASDVFSANAQVDSTIKLDGLVFRKNDNNEISVITKTAVASNNKLVTEQDIASLGSAMHYKGTINDPSAWPTTVAAGDVYIATGDRNFIYNGQQPPIEPGDMIVFNSENISDFTVVQSNLTLGTSAGQIAKNVGDLANGKMVIATSEGGGGIKTIEITETQLTGADNNKRDLSIVNGTADRDTTNNITLYHDVTISDALTVIGKPFTKSINISSTNRSIEIKKKTVDGVDTGVVVDLVWNTSIE